MLKSITLENYKSYNNEVSIDIKPLTILCGVNSCGKSSIIKSLLMMKQSYENNRANGEITYVGDYIDNGSYKSLANKKNKPIKIKNEFELIYNSQADKLMFRELYRLIFNENIKSNELNEKYGLFKLSISMEFISNVIKSYEIVINHFLLSSNIVLTVVRQDNKKYTISAFGDGEVCSHLPLNSCVQNCECNFDGIRVISAYTNEPPIGIDVSKFFNFVYGVFRVVSWQYTNDIEHIAPLRFSPHRYHITDGIYDFVGVSGEYTTQVLNKYCSKKFTNIPIPVNDELLYKTETEFLSYAVNQWLNYLDIGEYEITETGDESGNVLKLLINNQNISDVGFGVGQVLPIITQGLIMKKYQTLMLEQPEIHLHPKAQMKIADFLLSLAINRKNIIVETHSDHIINRIVRRVMESYGTKNDLSDLVQIYFIYKNNDGYSDVNKEIVIDKYKGLNNCPSEFFDQYGDELRLIMKLGFDNYRKG